MLCKIFVAFKSILSKKRINTYYINIKVISSIPGWSNKVIIVIAVSLTIIYGIYVIL